MKEKIELEEVIEYLTNQEIPAQFQLDQCTFITNTRLFIKTHIQILKANSGNKLMMPYYNRLISFYYAIKKTH